MLKPRFIFIDAFPPMRARISHAAVFGNMVFVSGLVARDPITGKPVAGGPENQTRQIMENLKMVLKEAGTSLEYVLKCGCFLRDISYFDAFNPVWESYFPGDPPARICVQAALGSGFDVEIDAIAGIPSLDQPSS
jgi:2-iminobutanoate/2-iminopropanoate deaminase